MIINDIIWKQQFVEKIFFKHQVSIDEVEEALNSQPLVCKVARGNVNDENIYAAYSQTHSGRYLIFFFINKKGNRVLPISARDMDNKERRYYENQTKHKKKKLTRYLIFFYPRKRQGNSGTLIVPVITRTI